MYELKPQPIRRSRLYEQVAGQIQRLIVSSGWPAGSKMPGERELGEQFGVSRTVIREALKTLSERGLVTVQPGRGIFVADPTSGALADPMRLLLERNTVSHGNLAEARRLLEVEIAGLAAERRLPEHIQRMKGAIDEMDLFAQNAVRFVKADQAFHAALAEATQNSLLRLLIDSIAETLEETRQIIFRVDGSPARGQDYHRRLLEAVVQQDAAGARKTMLEHLDQFERDISLAARRRKPIV